MTPGRKVAIETFIIRVISGFGVDLTKPYQSIGLIGLSQMDRDIPRKELLSVLQSMEGVVLDFDAAHAEVRIPTSFFLPPMA